jgi:hypothetical protein
LFETAQCRSARIEKARSAFAETGLVEASL